MSKKKSFTLVELLLVVIIIGTLFFATKNFFDTSRQEKVVFAETCINYLFGEVWRFNDTVRYKKNIWTGNIVWYTMTLIWNGVFPKNDLSKFAISTTATKDTWGMIYLDDYQFTHNSTYWWVISSPWIIRPTECSSSKYFIRSDFNFTGMSEDPLSAVVLDYDENGLNIWDWDPGVDSALTGQIILEACDATQIAEGHLFSTHSRWVKCMEVGKILVDKRIGILQTIKCGITDQENLICRSRPNQ